MHFYFIIFFFNFTQRHIKYANKKIGVDHKKQVRRRDSAKRC